MAIESNAACTVITGDDIPRYRLMVLYRALKLEILTGLKRSNRGRATGTIIRASTGIKARKKTTLLRQFAEWMEGQGIIDCAHHFREFGKGCDELGRAVGDVGYCHKCDGWYRGTIKDGNFYA